MGFLRENIKWLIVPFLMTMASGFGQSFFFGIFGNEIMAAFALSSDQWGLLYMIGTLAAGIAMIRYGRLADDMRLKTLTLFVLGAFALATFFMALNPVWFLLPVIIFGLRFLGQGMMTHIATITATRWFARNRGKATSFSALGFTLGEALFPFVFSAIILWLGWRGAWGVASLILLALIPLFAFLLSDARQPEGQLQIEARAGMDARHWQRRDMLRSPFFYLLLPAVLALPFCSTIFFFQLDILASAKGWETIALASFMPFYSVASVGAMLGFGVLIDRYSARQVMAFTMIPALFGYIILAQVQTLPFAASALFLLGLSQGAGSALSSVLWVEFFGSKYHGAIRSLSHGIMVFSTALGPYISGVLLVAGVGYDFILMGMAFYMGIACLLYGFVGVTSAKRFDF